jgi:hypothetical protein
MLGGGAIWGVDLGFGDRPRDCACYWGGGFARLSGGTTRFSALISALAA